MLIDVLLRRDSCAHYGNALRSVPQDSTGVSELYTRSVRRASGLVLVAKPETIPDPLFTLVTGSGVSSGVSAFCDSLLLAAFRCTGFDG